MIGSGVLQNFGHRSVKEMACLIKKWLKKIFRWECQKNSNVRVNLIPCKEKGPASETVDIFPRLTISPVTSLRSLNALELRQKEHRCRSRRTLGGAKDFCPNFPELARKKFKKKRLHLQFECHFCKIKAHTASLRRFTRFAQILRDFAGIFTKSKVLGVNLHPASYTKLKRVVCFLYHFFDATYASGTDSDSALSMLRFLFQSSGR